MSVKSVDYVDYLDELHINFKDNEDNVVCVKKCGGANIEYEFNGEIIRIVCPHIQKQLNFKIMPPINILNTEFDCTDVGNRVVFIVQIGNMQPFPISIKI